MLNIKIMNTLNSMSHRLFYCDWCVCSNAGTRHTHMLNSVFIFGSIFGCVSICMCSSVCVTVSVRANGNLAGVFMSSTHTHRSLFKKTGELWCHNNWFWLNVLRKRFNVPMFWIGRKIWRTIWLTWHCLHDSLSWTACCLSSDLYLHPFWSSHRAADR